VETKEMSCYTFLTIIFQLQAVKSQIAEVQKIANGSGSEQDIAEAKIELEVLETLQAVLK
jgi:F-type H+-transporting ATPase subunit delta